MKTFVFAVLKIKFFAFYLRFSDFSLVTYTLKINALLSYNVTYIGRCPYLFQRTFN
jgi:hypothetical protein